MYQMPKFDPRLPEKYCNNLYYVYMCTGIPLVLATKEFVEASISQKYWIFAFYRGISDHCMLIQ